MIEIRKATIEDLEDIQKLNLQLFKKEYKEYDKTLNLKWTFGKDGTEYFKKRIKDRRVIGYLVGTFHSPEAYRNLNVFAEGENMFILEKYRGKGIGTKLISKFIEWCKEKKAEKIRVIASIQNKKAIELYRKLGFSDYNLILEKEIN